MVASTKTTSFDGDRLVPGKCALRRRIVTPTPNPTKHWTALFPKGCRSAGRTQQERNKYGRFECVRLGGRAQVASAWGEFLMSFVNGHGLR